MSQESTERLLLAERHFSELAEQLQKLKSAAQAIEHAGQVTGQMRELAESAIKTADDLGNKIHETAEILQKQNIPQHLKDKETRQNTKFQELMDQVVTLGKSADAAAILLNQIQSSTSAGLDTLVRNLKAHADETTAGAGKTQTDLSSLKRILIALSCLHLGALGAIIYMISKR